MIFLLLGACETQLIPGFAKLKPAEPFFTLKPTTFERLSGWKADNYSDVLAVFLKSCEKLRALPPDQKFGPRPAQGRVSDWLSICDSGARIRPGNETEALYFFESRFTPYLALNNWTPEGLITGYYEPELRGAWQPDSVHRYPIHTRPEDLISVDLGKFRPEWKGRHIAGQIAGNKFVPYATRGEIDNGALQGRQLELLWVDNPLDAFFLHIQGSGRVVMPDGSVVRVGYAGRNGHRYTPIGRELVAAGVLPMEKVSMQSIRAWLAANPLAAVKIMERNKSYVFFRVIKGDGPIGAQGVVLTPGRSLAVDRKYIPLGVPIWLNTVEPGKSKKPLRRLVISQDSGSAIKGPIRGDLFFGFGNAAGIKAGQMKEAGTYYLLLPKTAAP